MASWGLKTGCWYTGVCRYPALGDGDPVVRADDALGGRAVGGPPGADDQSAPVPRSWVLLRHVVVANPLTRPREVDDQAAYYADPRCHRVVPAGRSSEMMVVGVEGL